jgi:hypothetical protein
MGFMWHLSKKKKRKTEERKKHLFLHPNKFNCNLCLFIYRADGYSSITEAIGADHKTKS